MVNGVHGVQIPRVVSVDTDQCSEMICSKCGGNTFIEATRWFKVSPLHPVVPNIDARVPVRVCTACQTPLDKQDIKTLNIQIR